MEVELLIITERSFARATPSKTLRQFKLETGYPLYKYWLNIFNSLTPNTMDKEKYDKTKQINHHLNDNKYATKIDKDAIINIHSTPKIFAMPIFNLIFLINKPHTGMWDSNLDARQNACLKITFVKFFKSNKMTMFCNLITN